MASLEEDLRREVGYGSAKRFGEVIVDAFFGKSEIGETSIYAE